MKKNPFRRYTDEIRLLADKLWDQGHKDIAQDLHIAAAKEWLKKK